MEEKWLTAKEAAERLNVHRQFIYAACATLELKHTRLGKGRGSIRIRPSWLDVWSESKVIG